MCANNMGSEPITGYSMSPTKGLGILVLQTHWAWLIKQQGMY